jgi:predicted GIY-YIG superfamily endonuclease
MEHNSGKGAKYTSSRRPVELVGISPEMTKSEALKLEYRIKHLPVDKKISELTKGESEMTMYKNDLQALNKDIKALSRKVEKLIKGFDKSKKAKVTAKSLKTKTIKRVPVKKATAKNIPAKVTATDQVLKIIMGRKRGVDVATLMNKTRFNEKKIWNILHRAFKAGKIKRVDRGKYVGA